MKKAAARQCNHKIGPALESAVSTEYIPDILHTGAQREMTSGIKHAIPLLLAGVLCLEAGGAREPRDPCGSREAYDGAYLQPAQFGGGRTVPAEAKPGMKSAAVLCYHSFLGTHRYPTDFSIADIEAQLGFLESNGFRFVTFDGIIAGSVTGRRNILITIDDGNVSAVIAYRAVFRKHGIKPLFAIYPSAIGMRSYAMTWKQVRALSDDGCVIASHGYSHQRMSDEAETANPAMIEREISVSKKILEERTERPISVFVYPYGIYGKNIPPRLGAAGYRYAFTIRHGTIAVPVSPGSELFLPRFMLTVTNAKSLMSELAGTAGH